MRWSRDWREPSPESWLPPRARILVALRGREGAFGRNRVFLFGLNTAGSSRGQDRGRLSAREPRSASSDAALRGPAGAIWVEKRSSRAQSRSLQRPETRAHRGPSRCLPCRAQGARRPVATGRRQRARSASAPAPSTASSCPRIGRSVVSSSASPDVFTSESHRRRPPDCPRCLREIRQPGKLGVGGFCPSPRGARRARLRFGRLSTFRHEGSARSRHSSASKPRRARVVGRRKPATNPEGTLSSARRGSLCEGAPRCRFSSRSS